MDKRLPNERRRPPARQNPVNRPLSANGRVRPPVRPGDATKDRRPVAVKDKPNDAAAKSGISGGALITLSVVAVLLLITVLLLVVPGFRIKNIHISGLYRCSEEEVLQTINIDADRLFLKELGGDLKLFFRGRYGSIEERLEQGLGKVEEAVVTYSYPSTLNVEITERVSLAFVKLPDAYAILDKNSIVTDIVYDKPNLPAIEGLTVYRAQAGNTIETALPDMLKMSLSIMNILVQADMKEPGELLIERVTTLKPTEQNEIYLTVKDGTRTYRVLCRQNAQLQQHFQWLKRVVNTDLLADKGDGFIDLTGANPYFKPDKD